jgi:deoxyribose-phosphate aldolase
MSGEAAVAARALACLDLTNLDDACDTAAVDALCERARTPRGPVAAVCLWPRFTAQAREALDGSGIRIATVVNFPVGDRDLDHVAALTLDALAEGADEIDMVIPWRDLAAGRDRPVRTAVRRVRETCGPAVLKTILETGELGQPDLIRRAAEIALEEGADFLKTSTGKVKVNATLKAAEILLNAIAASGRDAGLKAAGGIRSTEDAAGYLHLCDRLMGPYWAGPARFRIGASGLLDALLATLDGAEAPAGGAGY